MKLLRDLAFIGAEAVPWCDLCAVDVETLLRAVLDGAKAAGWQLVPTKHDGKAGLTHEMCDAFWARYKEAEQRHGHYESTNAGYNAMISAAPDVTKP